MFAVTCNFFLCNKFLVLLLKAENPHDPRAQGVQDRYIPDLEGNYPGPIRTYEQINDTVPVYRKVRTTVFRQDLVS